MSRFRLEFSGEVKRVEHRTAGGKALVEFSLCRKNRTKEGEPEAFTWVKVQLWEPADWLANKLTKGAFVAGSGDLTLRSYQKDGQKDRVIEVRCSGFDIDMARDAQPAPAEEGETIGRNGLRQNPRPAAGGGDLESPPFARSELEAAP